MFLFHYINILFHYNKGKLLSTGREIKLRHPGSSVDRALDVTHNKCTYVVVMLHLKTNVGHCDIHVIVE